MCMIGLNVVVATVCVLSCSKKNEMRLWIDAKRPVVCIVNGRLRGNSHEDVTLTRRVAVYMRA